MSNEIDNITIQYDNIIDNITIQHTDIIEGINVDYINEVKNITLVLGTDIQSVFTVNELTGFVTLSNSTTLSTFSSSANGVYSYIYNHNLEYIPTLVSIYDTNNKLVIGDIKILNSNSVMIESLIDLTGYKVVIQR